VFNLNYNISVAYNDVQPALNFKTSRLANVIFDFDATSNSSEP